MSKKKSEGVLCQHCLQCIPYSKAFMATRDQYSIVVCLPCGKEHQENIIRTYMGKPFVDTTNFILVDQTPSGTDRFAFQNKDGKKVTLTLDKGLKEGFTVLNSID